MSIWKLGDNLFTIGGAAVSIGGPTVTTYGNNEKLSGWTALQESEFNAGASDEQSMAKQADGDFGPFTLTEAHNFSIGSAAARANNAGATALMRICLYHFNKSTLVIGALVGRSSTTAAFATDGSGDHTSLSLQTWDLSIDDDFQDVQPGDYIWSLQGTNTGFKVAASIDRDFSFTYLLADTRSTTQGDPWDNGDLPQGGNRGKLVIFGEASVVPPAGSPTLTAPYDAEVSSLGDSINITTNFTGATSYAAQDLPDGCGINPSTGAITGTVKSLIAGVPTVIAINEFSSGILAAIPWTVHDPRLSAVAVSGGAVTFDGVTIAADAAIYVSPFGLLTATQNDGNIGTVDGSGSDLIISGTTITSPTTLYLSPAGVLTDQPNGAPVATFN